MAKRTEKLPPLQKASKQLFGGAYSLEIGVWIWEFGTALINPTAVRSGLQLTSEAPPAHSSVVVELENLTAAGRLF